MSRNAHDSPNLYIMNFFYLNVVFVRLAILTTLMIPVLAEFLRLFVQMKT